MCTDNLVAKKSPRLVLVLPDSHHKIFGTWNVILKCHKAYGIKKAKECFPYEYLKRFNQLNKKKPHPTVHSTAISNKHKRGGLSILRCYFCRNRT